MAGGAPLPDGATGVAVAAAPAPPLAGVAAGTVGCGVGCGRVVIILARKPGAFNPANFQFSPWHAAFEQKLSFVARPAFLRS